MPETLHSFSHLETPASDSTLVCGQHMMRGWVWPRSGGVLVDVRARVGEQLFPGVHGIPRADLAAHFQTGHPVALAEFYLVVELSAGFQSVILEHLNIEGHWQAFHTASYHVTDSATPATIPLPSTPLRWHEYGRALQILLREQRSRPHHSLAQLTSELVARIPHPRDLRHPHHPFHGHLDEPAAITRCRFGRSPVLGWLFHETQPIKRVLATFDLQVWQPIEHTHDSPAVAEQFPQFPNARKAGLFGIIDVPSQLPDPATLRLYAELEDGSLHLCSVARASLFPNEEEKKPYAPQDRCSVDRTMEALNASLEQNSIELIRDDELSEEIKQVRTDFTTQAPPTLPVANSTPQIAAAPGSNAFPQRILLATHNLNLEGAPLFLLDLALHYAAQGASITIISPSDGPLRTKFASCGATVQIVDVANFFAAKTRSEALHELDTIGHAVAFSDHDLIVCNTFTTFWAVHAGKAANLPVLLYVHESTTPTIFYGDRVPPIIVDLATESFQLSDTVSFTTKATQSYHRHYGNPYNHVTTPGWIHIPPIDQFLRKTSREQMRAPFQLQPDQFLVTNVGTVSDRKGQHTFVRAVDLFCRRYPDLASRTKFVMLGDRDGIFHDMLMALLNEVNLPNLELHPETTEYLPYYAAADLTVCTSHEESSPRIVLETMACEIPLLTSDVQGIPELVRPDLEATLIPAGDTSACCHQMAHLLRNPQVGQTLAKRARARVHSHFSAQHLLPQHGDLVRDLVANR